MSEPTFDQAKRICDRIRSSSERIRHAGYYDSFGRILYDSERKGVEPLKGEGVEEMHILNGTAATTLVLWKSSDYLLGRMDAYIMIREKIVDLIVPYADTGSYFLVVFEKSTPLSEVENVRKRIIETSSP